MRVRIADVWPGRDFKEKIIMIETVEGSEELAVDRWSVQEQSLDVGFPVDEQDGQFLIQLPRETFRGVWRVWVDQGIVLD